jgi:hypothetical protein
MILLFNGSISFKKKKKCDQQTIQFREAQLKKEEARDHMLL